MLLLLLLLLLLRSGLRRPPLELDGPEARREPERAVPAPGREDEARPGGEKGVAPPQQSEDARGAVGGGRRRRSLLLLLPLLSAESFSRGEEVLSRAREDSRKLREVG